MELELKKNNEKIIKYEEEIIRKNHLIESNIKLIKFYNKKIELNDNDIVELIMEKILFELKIDELENVNETQIIVNK